MKLNKYAMVACLGLAASGCAHGRGDGTETLRSKENSLTLMKKPGIDVVRFTEAGRDVEQLDGYTLVSAELDGNIAGEYHGAAHLYKDGVAITSYNVETTSRQDRFARIVAMSASWLGMRVRDIPYAPTEYRDAILVVGKDSSGEFKTCGDYGSNGELPNCVSCQVEAEPSDLPIDERISCTAKPQVELVRPTSLGDDETIVGFELSNDELFVAAPTRMFVLKYNGSSWVEQSVFPLLGGYKFKEAVSVNENRLAATVAGGEDVDQHVAIYEKSSSGWWSYAFPVRPAAGVLGFGKTVDIHGSSLVAVSSSAAHLIDLRAQGASSSESGVRSACSVAGNFFDMAISGSNVLLATTTGAPRTYSRAAEWQLQGGLPEGFFPREQTGSMWGAGADGDQLVIGWRNYQGETPDSATGAALAFGFAEYDCGEEHQMPNGDDVYAGTLEVSSVAAPGFSQFPVENAIDGDGGTRWMAPMTPGTEFTVDLGELRVLNHLEIDWGTTYSDDFSISVSEDGSTYFPVGNFGGNGNEQLVDLRNESEAFGRWVKIKMNGFELQPGTGDWGVAIREIRVFRRVNAACQNAGPLSCTGEETSHVCGGECGGRVSEHACWCDAACANFNDCCSFDGQERGKEYGSGVANFCEPEL